MRGWMRSVRRAAWGQSFPRSPCRVQGDVGTRSYPLMWVGGRPHGTLSKSIFDKRERTENRSKSGGHLLGSVGWIYFDGVIIDKWRAAPQGQKRAGSMNRGARRRISTSGVSADLRSPSDVLAGPHSRLKRLKPGALADRRGPFGFGACCRCKTRQKGGEPGASVPPNSRPRGDESWTDSFPSASLSRLGAPVPAS